MGFLLNNFMLRNESIEFDLNDIIPYIITAYMVTYILFAVISNTCIKRLKARLFIKNTLIYKIFKLIKKIITKIVEKIKRYYLNITYSKAVLKKLMIYILINLFIASVIYIMFRNSYLVIIFEMILCLIIIRKIVKLLKNFEMIEKKLKEMKEGNNSTKLNNNQFEPEFQKMVSYINDISNGVEIAIQDRIKSEKFKAELITNVSHDIKTPLTSIINYVDLLKKEKITNNKIEEYVEILENKSQRLKKLTEDLIDASKFSTGNISLKLEKINIVELIKQAIGEFEDKFKQKNLDIILETKTNEIYIKADSKYMYRIVENLFSNISKYALENSRIYINFFTENSTVKIEIKNISKEKLNITAEELMQRFVRGDKSRTTEGSGLGIFIAQNLTEQQNGMFNLILDGDLFKTELIFNIIK